MCVPQYLQPKSLISCMQLVIVLLPYWYYSWECSCAVSICIGRKWSHQYRRCLLGPVRSATTLCVVSVPPSRSRALGEFSVGRKPEWKDCDREMRFSCRAALSAAILIARYPVLKAACLSVRCAVAVAVARFLVLSRSILVLFRECDWGLREEHEVSWYGK